MIGLLLTLEFLSCQFDMFFRVFRAEIIARFGFRSFLSSLNFVVGGGYMVCDHRCVTALQRFLWILWHLLPDILWVFVTTRNWTHCLRQYLWHQPRADRSTWNSMISQAVAICCFMFCKLKAQTCSHSHKYVAASVGKSIIQKTHNSISER